MTMMRESVRVSVWGHSNSKWPIELANATTVRCHTLKPVPQFLFQYTSKYLALDSAVQGM